MARITSAALALLLCLSSSTSAAAASTTIIDSTGSLTRTQIPQSTIGNGIVSILSSPGTPSFFPTSGSESDSGEVTISNEGGVSILSSPGATASSISGNGAVAAASVSGCIVLSGITESDLEYGIEESRHGQTLNGIFKQRVEDVSGSSADDDGKVTLILAVPSTDSEGILKDVEAIFDSACAEVGGDVALDDLYDVSVEIVESEADAQRVMKMASDAASQTTVSSNISSTIANVYTKTSSSTTAAATAAILACDDSFARNQRTTRARLSSWKSRTARNLLIDNFGSAAAGLLKRTMESFDRDTLSAAGVGGSAAAYRLEVRSKLKGRVETAIRDLFAVQTDILTASTLKKFNAMLLRKANDNYDMEQFYNDNAAAVRSAAFTFDSAMDDLEVPSLSLTKSKASQEMSSQLNTALLAFPDSPAAKLKRTKKVSRIVNKQKEPSERAVDFGFDFVAMLRPDGFGNGQGFVGYQMKGGTNVIVGVHNDADDPGVISQFGGKRPPFLRVQPKLKVNVEL